MWPLIYAVRISLSSKKWLFVNSIFSTTNMSSSTLYVGQLLTEKWDGTTA